MFSTKKNLCVEYDTNKRCEHCNLPGHNISKCQIKENNIKIENIQSNNVMKSVNYKYKCNFCGSMSHLENQCWKKYPQMLQYGITQITNIITPIKIIIIEMTTKKTQH